MTTKIFASILNDRLTYWAENEGMLTQFQFGFRKERSTVDCTFILMTLMQRELLKKRRKLYVVFIDFKKAFDRVDHDLLWRKLRRMGVSDKIIRILENMYEGNTASIRMTPWRRTEDFNINIGVKQGCLLSPLLFSLYLNDLPEALTRAKTLAPALGDQEIPCLMYADDLAILSESPIGLPCGTDP